MINDSLMPIALGIAKFFISTRNCDAEQVANDAIGILLEIPPRHLRFDSYVRAFSESASSDNSEYAQSGFKTRQPAKEVSPGSRWQPALYRFDRCRQLHLPREHPRSCMHLRGKGAFRAMYTSAKRPCVSAGLRHVVCELHSKRDCSRIGSRTRDHPHPHPQSTQNTRIRNLLSPTSNLQACS